MPRIAPSPVLAKTQNQGYISIRDSGYTQKGQQQTDSIKKSDEKLSKQDQRLLQKLS